MSCDVTERDSLSRARALFQASRGQRVKRERLGTTLTLFHFPYSFRSPTPPHSPHLLFLHHHLHLRCTHPPSPSSTRCFPLHPPLLPHPSPSTTTSSIFFFLYCSFSSSTTITTIYMSPSLSFSQSSSSSPPLACSAGVFWVGETLMVFVILL